MAKKVASFWPLSFDTSRSQSRLRVATTAAPVSAADLYNTWMEGAYMDEASVRGVPKNSRGSTPDNSVRVGAGVRFVCSPPASLVPDSALLAPRCPRGRSSTCKCRKQRVPPHL